VGTSSAAAATRPRPSRPAAGAAARSASPPARRWPDARITIQVGARERLEPAISKATPLGALGTGALVWIGATCISGSATAMRALADALVEAAELADDYDADPDAFNEHEQAERDPDH
jgi:hypothetical protein